MSTDFVPHLEILTLMNQIPYLASGHIRQSTTNTLTVTVDRGGPVQFSFFGGLNLGQVAQAEAVAGPAFKVASLIDLAGTKAAVVTQRAELRDYIDIHCLIQAGISLAEMLAAASVIYGAQFNPLISLKAIAYHDDPTLADMPAGVREDLRHAVVETDPDRLPVLPSLRSRADGP
jgi:hypothetical protein